MTVSPFDSQLFAQLLSDDEIAPLFSDKMVLRAIVDFEIALAKIEAEAGVIPRNAFEEIALKLTDFNPNPSDLSLDTGIDGVPVPALLKLARQLLGNEIGQYLHWGATSQDAIDTSLVLRIAQVIELLERRLSSTHSKLSSLANKYAETTMVGRTRSQQAIPTTFGYKLLGWAEPLNRHLDRLQELKPRLLVLSFGGAVGTLAALGNKANEVSQRLAEELGLHLPGTAWHTQRDNLAEFANWLSLLTGSLGKMGQDLILLSQSEVLEVCFTSGGGSSTMPQKSNPIAAEVLITLARFNAGQLNLIHQGLIQEHERGGPGWMLEWMVLPQMILAAAVALKDALRVLDGLEVREVRMKTNLEQANGLSLCEAAVFALSAHMNRSKAELIVKTASQQAQKTNEHVIDVIARQVQYPIDWRYLKRHGKYVGLAVERARNTKLKSPSSIPVQPKK